MERKTLTGMVLLLLSVSFLVSMFNVQPIKAIDPCDLNEDGKVDGRDIAIVAKAFGSFAGPPPHDRWNATADVTLDDRVDGRDIIRVASHFTT